MAAHQQQNPKLSGVALIRIDGESGWWDKMADNFVRNAHDAALHPRIELTAAQALPTNPELLRAGT